MRVTDYIASIGSCTTVDALEGLALLANQFAEGGSTASRIRNAITASGLAICNAHALGHLVPRLDGTAIVVCRRRFVSGRVSGRADARRFIVDTLVDHGLSRRAVDMILNTWRDHPHRCLAIIEQALRGALPDTEGTDAAAPLATVSTTVRGSTRHGERKLDFLEVQHAR